jgi:hypothetical protein
VAFRKRDLPLVHRIINLDHSLIELVFDLNCIKMGLETTAINLHELFVHHLFKVGEFLVKNASAHFFAAFQSLLQELSLSA